MSTNVETKNYHITAIMSSKGGVGKTTSTAVIAQVLALSGQKVLVIDFDYQRNLTDMMAKDINQMPERLADDIVLNDLEIDEIKQTIIPTKFENMDLIPMSPNIQMLHYALYDRVKDGDQNVMMCLRNNLLKLAGTEYDHILFDNSPVVVSLTTATLLCCDRVLIPVESDNFGYQSVVNINRIVSEINGYYELNEEKKVYVFMTKVQSRTTRSKDMFAGYSDLLGDEMFLPVSIRLSEPLGRSSANFIPIMLPGGDKRNEAVNEYIDLLKAIDFLNGKQFINVKRYQEGTGNKKKAKTQKVSKTAKTTKTTKTAKKGAKK